MNVQCASYHPLSGIDYQLHKFQGYEGSWGSPGTRLKWVAARFLSQLTSMPLPSYFGVRVMKASCLDHILIE